MSRFYLGNNGGTLCFTDINLFGDGNRAYWWDSEATLFRSDGIYSSCVSKSTNPIPASMATAAQTDAAIKLRFDNEWYWLIGDILHGGIGICYDSVDHIAMYYFTVNLEEHTAAAWFNGQAFHKNQNFYIIDTVYSAGTSVLGQGLIVSDTNGNFTIGYNEPVYTPLVGITAMTQVETASVRSLPVGNSIPPLPAKSVKVNAKTTNGIKFTLYDATIIDIPEQGWCKVNYYPFAPAWWENLENETYQPDPGGGGGGENSTGGGNGQPQSSVDIDFPALPPDVLINSGIIKMFAPTVNEIKSLMNYIYSAPTAIIDNFKKIWSNPMESIISFGVVPWYIDPSTLVTEEVNFCGVKSGVYMHVLPSQYKEVDCGVLTVNEEYNSLLDYSTYTRIKLFLPFIGCVDLNDDCMGATMHLKYFIDILSGECVANLKCTKTDSSLDYSIEYNSVMYQFKGNVLTSAPLTGNNWQQLYSGVLNLVQTAALPTPVGIKMASMAGQIAGDLTSQKVQVQRAGSITANSGTLGEYLPYIILEKEIRSVPVNNDKYNGYPLNWGGTIKSFRDTVNDFNGDKASGYTVIRRDSMRLNDINATDTEKQMIKDILETGFVL